MSGRVPRYLCNNIFQSIIRELPAVGIDYNSMIKTDENSDTRRL